MTAPTIATGDGIAGSTADATGRSRRRLLAVALPVSAVLLCGGSAPTPKGLDQLITSTATADQVLDLAQGRTSLLYATNLALLFGLGALALSFGALATLVRGRASSLATVGAMFGGTGCFAGALGNVLPGFNVAATVSARVPRPAAESFLVTTFTSAAGRTLLTVYLGGMLIGTVLMAVALWRSRAVPPWLAALFGAGLVVATFAPVGPLAIPLQLPFGLAMILLGREVWRASTDN